MRQPYVLSLVFVHIWTAQYLNLKTISISKEASSRMSGLAEAIRRCNLPLKLDNNTEGYGNCFPNAVIQQCRRPEIKNWLCKNNPIGIVKSPQALRRQVTQFALNCQHKNLNDYKIKVLNLFKPAILFFIWNYKFLKMLAIFTT